MRRHFGGCRGVITSVGKPRDMHVSFDDFGEGSFDKGMFFKIPLHTLLNKNVRSSYSTRIRPVQRDGGARLEDFSGNIWWDLRGVRYDALQEDAYRLSR